MKPHENAAPGAAGAREKGKLEREAKPDFRTQSGEISISYRVTIDIAKWPMEKLLKLKELVEG